MCKIIILIIVCGFSAISISAQTTAFTYQGKLTDGGASPTGTYEMEFKVFNLLTGGTQQPQGAPVTLSFTVAGNNAVSVTNGVFTVSLDFGFGVFTGANRFLEISVRRNSSESFVPLSSRQKISATPYAIQSLNSDSLGGIASTGFIRNTMNTEQLAADFNISGSGRVGTNLRVGSRFYLDNGNVVGGRLTALETGDIGIGTSSPASKLHVYGSPILRVSADSDSNAGFGLRLNNALKWSLATVSGGQFQIYNDAISQNAVWIASASNNVGIGTTSPEQKLHVDGNEILSTGSQSGFKFRARGSTSSTGDWVWYADSTNFAYLWHAGFGDLLRVNPEGLLAIKIFGGGTLSLCRDAVGNVRDCSSSLRYKTNIASFSSGLSFIKQLHPITFDWKQGGMRDVGFGAEDVAKINPLFVTYNKDGLVEGVKYDRLSVAFVNAFKEQQGQIEQQQKLIETQQQQIEALKKLICASNRDAGICKQ